MIFSVFDTEIWDIFHDKRSSAYRRWFGIKKIAEFGGFTFFSFGQQSVRRSLTLRFSAYFGRVQPVLEVKKCVDSIGQSGQCKHFHISNNGMSSWIPFKCSCNKL